MYTSADFKLVCGVLDFEVTVEGKIIALTDSISATNDGVYLKDPDSGVFYTMYNNKKGLTLINDEPIFIDMDNKTSSHYNSEEVVSISAGIDSSLWALQNDPDSKDYKVLKWQEDTNRWYKVEGVSGINIAAYNEISLAIVNSDGLVKLSSSKDQQDDAVYTS